MIRIFTDICGYNTDILESKLQFDFTTSQAVIRKIAFIEAFKGQWQTIERQGSRHLRALRKIATIQSIGSSTRIEGATLTDKEVEQLLRNMKITKFETRDEQEVAGYYEALDLILENHKEVDITENHIKQLHKTLLRHSDKDHHHRGQYKMLTNKVVATYPDGTQRTIFNTTEPHLTPKEMDELLGWTNEQFAAGQLHDLIIIGFFVYEFLSIHPFQDGNGRLSRLLTTLLLLKRNYPFVQYISFEHIIEERKTDYYAALMAGQQNRYRETERIDAWMLFFLDCLETLIRRLEAKYTELQKLGSYLLPRQKTLLEFLEQNKQAKLADFTTNLPDVPVATLKKDLQKMVQEGIFEKIGQGKATIYILPAKS